MPQLSPLNWIFLFIMFWTTVLGFSVLIWWSKKTFFKSKSISKSFMKANKWNW
uniref:ATP synthase F0 subunit 8 n=1 Tax=Fulgoraria rupestris rupestris TaxID=3082331 RepID=UPI002A80E716|nr:ATP synthase F0 subunit 8 [Fulgoraria rupestris rupestris]WOJ51892.1 ATP synthase F0 subunit 8 [Fulgoraria rupestris rupestris]